MNNEKVMAIELEEALADYISYGADNGGQNLFGDILDRICSLEQAGDILSRHAEELASYVQSHKIFDGRITFPTLNAAESKSPAERQPSQIADPQPSSKRQSSQKADPQPSSKRQPSQNADPQLSSQKAGIFHDVRHIAIGAFDTALMVILTFFLTLSLLQHFYTLG